MGYSAIVVRLVAAALVGGVLGLNRNLRGKAAGLRTHALVSLGAALTVLAAELAIEGSADHAAVTRAMQGIIAGVGFLGAGTILKTRSTRGHGIRGLTTAATIWFAASLGMACGAGFAGAAVVAVIVALLVLMLGKRVEQWFDRITGRAPRNRSAPPHHDRTTNRPTV